MDVRTQAAEIDRAMNQEIVFARLCTSFAILALVIGLPAVLGASKLLQLCLFGMKANDPLALTSAV